MRFILILILITFSSKILPSSNETKIVGEKIKQLGYEVDYLPINSLDQLGALRQGIVHFQIEMWQSHDDGSFMQAVNKGFVEDMGLHRAIGREDWWYPAYVEDACPGLPDWQALKACSKLFSPSDKSNKGTYYTGPWNYRDADLIRALDLNFTITRLKNAKQIWQKLNQAQALKQPIVLLNWTPNWIDVRIKGHFIDFPDFEKACEKDPAWGINKEIAFDCGNPKITLIKKAAWPGLKHQSPCIYQLLKKINFTTDMIAEASALFGTEENTEQQAIEKWLEKFASQNSDWLSFTCMSP